MSRAEPDLASRPESSSCWPWGLGLALLALALGYQVFALTRPLEVLVDRVFERDDAFYYFVTARNIVTLGWSTFDGLHASSGVQLLWTGLLIPLAWAFSGDEAYLRAVLVLCLLCNILSAYLLYRFCRRAHSPILGDIALALFAGVLVERWNTLQGMEYPLHIAILLAIALCGWRLVSEREDRLALLLGLLLALNFWTRLDSAVVSVAVWGLACVSLYRGTPRWRARIGQLTLAPALAAVAYIATSYTMAGTFLPLSGDVKAHYARHYFDGYPASVALVELVRGWLKVQLNGPLAILPSNVLEMGLGEGYYPFSQPDQFVLTLFTAAMLAGGTWAILRQPAASPERRLLRLGVFVFAVMLAQSALCVAVMKEFAFVSRHYYALHLLFWIVWTALLLTIGLRALAPRFGRAPAAALALLAVVAYGQIAVAWVRAPLSDRNYAIARLRLAAQLGATLPPDAIVGAWNAGVLGYFLDRPVVNLDGLVNDREFLSVLEQGTPLRDYLRRTGITHLIDHDRRDLTLRFREVRGENGEFRNGILWSEVEELTRMGSIYLLKFRG